MISNNSEGNPSSLTDNVPKAFFIKMLKAALLDSEEIWNRNKVTQLLFRQVVCVGILHALNSEVNNRYNFESLLGLVTFFMNSQIFCEIARRELQIILEYITVVWRFVSVKNLQHQSILGFFEDLLSSFDTMVFLFRPQNSELLPNILQK
jgi:hypothetical protein